jgi:hypothetical protein
VRACCCTTTAAAVGAEGLLSGRVLTCFSCNCLLLFVLVSACALLACFNYAAVASMLKCCFLYAFFVATAALHLTTSWFCWMLLVMLGRCGCWRTVVLLMA